jgi:hypothetical protein
VVQFQSAGHVRPACKFLWLTGLRTKIQLCDRITLGCVWTSRGNTFVCCCASICWFPSCSLSAMSESSSTGAVLRFRINLRYEIMCGPQNLILRPCASLCRMIHTTSVLSGQRLQLVCWTPKRASGVHNLQSSCFCSSFTLFGPWS